LLLFVFAFSRSDLKKRVRFYLVKSLEKTSSTVPTLTSNPLIFVSPDSSSAVQRVQGCLYVTAKGVLVDQFGNIPALHPRHLPTRQKGPLGSSQIVCAHPGATIILTFAFPSLSRICVSFKILRLLFLTTAKVKIEERIRLIPTIITYREGTAEQLWLSNRMRRMSPYLA
jgi:hypothetical protein